MTILSSLSEGSFNVLQQALKCFLIGMMAAGFLACSSVAYAADAPSDEPGVMITYTLLDQGNKAADVGTISNLWLYVPAGNPATPFLPAGPFTAMLEGDLNLDLRSEYSFEAELSGQVKLEVNGAVVLEGDKGKAQGQPVRLNKGKNAFKASFRSPGKEDAYLRIFWKPKGGMATPVPSASLTHSTASVEWRQGRKLREGRELFVEHRCASCHQVPDAKTGMAELSMDAPSFDGIGDRRKMQWMVDWILDPKAQRTSARMPQVFHGAKAKEQAEAAAAYLASLKGGAKFEAKAASDESKEAGKGLFERLHCAACHTSPEEGNDAVRISLKHVRRKFTPGALSSFLKKPDEHFAWIRMPNFKLSDEEALQLTAYLEANADETKDSPAAPSEQLVEEGKKLVQTAGCLNCHSHGIQNQFAAKGLTDLAAAKWTHGCLADSQTEDSKAPRFHLSAEQRDALRAFGNSDRSSLSRHVRTEFAGRQMQQLNCTSCHGKYEGFPAVDILGGKLKPEWSTKFIAGEVSYKPRPWLDARMPAFTRRAEDIAQGIAMQHGYAPKTTPEPAIDHEAAKVGQKLVSAEGGFACVACHGVGKVGATQVFESAGINLAYSEERLLKPFYTRWVFNPLSIDPTTKMPVYFDEEGKSPLAEVYEGDGGKQIEAIWQYIRLGDKMPPPPGTEQGSPEH